MQTRMMLVEDRADFRHLMAAWLGRELDLEVVAQAGRWPKPAAAPRP